MWSHVVEAGNAGVRQTRRWTTAVALSMVAACGGGGGGSSSPVTPPAADGFAPSATLAAMCAAPRTGTDPSTGTAYPDHQGTLTNEQTWLRSYMNESYLWYDQVPTINPALYSVAANGSVFGAMDAYFLALRTPVITASGKREDAFSFAYQTAAWDALSQSGVQPGYGVEWSLIAASPPRKVVVAYQDPGVTAPASTLERGAQVLTIDGVDVANGSDVATLNAGLAPSTVGESHVFSILDVGATTPRTVTLMSSNVTLTPVQNVSSFAEPGGTVGYMLFNDHIATSESELVSAVQTLQTDNITDLVLDIRYNGGGFLAIASELAFMIAGPTTTNGATFEKLVFNPHDALASAPGNTTPFYSTGQGFSTAAGTPLPQLGLTRVYVLTGPETCSASEAIINGLRGVNVQVVLIGATTCGKPYGFYQKDNCGTSYFAIEFQGENAVGFGAYADGFAPTCAIADDFDHALGDPNEGRFSAAITYRGTGVCPPASTTHAQSRFHVASAAGAIVSKAPWRDNRLVGVSR